MADRFLMPNVNVKVLCSVLLATLVVTSGCDAVEEAWRGQELESTLRNEPGRAGKVGTLQGLHVRRTAIEFARASRVPLLPECAVTPEAGVTRRVELTIERARGDETITRWDEVRRFRAGERNSAFEWSADYLTLANTTGTTGGSFIVTPEATWVGRLPGPLYFRRDELRPELWQRITGPLDALLGMGRWRKDGPRRWVAGDEPIRCAEPGRDSAWLARIEANHPEIVRQRFELSAAGERQLLMEWSLTDGTSLTVEWSETLEKTGEPTSPSESQIVDVERDLSYKLGSEKLEEWVDEGLVIRPAPSRTDEEEDD